MRPALVLVDIQRDFLDRPGLNPEPTTLVAAAATLLDAFRTAQFPVVHVRTEVAADGSDAMPHWRRLATLPCRRGSAGAAPPAPLAEAADEPTVAKRYFSGFDDGRLDALLRERGVDTVVLAGLYTHGCIRATAVDAYRLGYAVLVAADAVASDDPAHALASRLWLADRIGEFLPAAALLTRVGAPRTANTPAESTPVTANTPAESTPATAMPPSEADLPATIVAGRWIACDAASPCEWIEHVDPSDESRRLARVPVADAAAAGRAVHELRLAQHAWAATDGAERARRIDAWADAIASRSEIWSRDMARQIGKPVTDAREEVGRAVAHVRTAARLAVAGDERHADGVATRYRPHGVIAAITPWNNPLAIAAAKIAAALACGNAVAWKPAPAAAALSLALADSLVAAGLPPGLLATVFGDAGTAQALILDPGVSAVTLTGSPRAGIEAAQLCARRGIPLQAELGGNNAAVVMADADLDAAAMALAASAFGFAGQRCTATRRIIVHQGVRDAFLRRLLDATAALTVGDPLDPATRVGPLVSPQRRTEVAAAVERALADGGRLLCGGAIPSGPGCWYPPTLVEGLPPGATLVQQESFGPVAVLQDAADLDQALRQCNGVAQGLVASFYGADGGMQREFLARAEAGILRINPVAFPVAADAPFGGWKASGLGPPEHGRWDLEFFARPQAIYGRLA